MAKPNSEQLTVTIMGHQYILSCPPEEKEGLLAAVAYVDEKMNNIRQVGKTKSTDRIAVFAALDIANELLTTRAPEGGFADLAFGEFQRRIQSMSATLESALSPQEKLF